MSFPRALAAGALVGFVLGSLVIADSNTYELGEALAVWVVTSTPGALAGAVLVLLARLARKVRATVASR